MSCRERRLDRIRNCEEVTNKNIAWVSMPGQDRCPISQRTEEADLVLEWWSEWRTLGVLPWEGLMADQPQFVIDALALCEQVAAEDRAKAPPKAQGTEK